MKNQSLPVREYEAPVESGVPESGAVAVTQFIHKRKRRKQKKEIALSTEGKAAVEIVDGLVPATPQQIANAEKQIAGVIEAQDKLQSIIEVKQHDVALIAAAPDDQSLEAGMATLAGELLVDARDMLKVDRLDPPKDPEILIKRRTYMTNVLNHVARTVNGRAAIRIKKSEEKRNDTDFLMKLLAKAQAGTISDAEMAVLESNYAQEAASQKPKPVAIVDVTTGK